MSSRSSRRGRGSDRLLEVAAGSDDYQALPVEAMYAAPPQPVDGPAAGAPERDVAAVAGGKGPSKHPRLQSLDVFRGLTVSWMILVDDAGATYDHWMDHSPWNNPTLADFVFPFFMFITGVSVALSYKRLLSKPGNKGLATRKAFVRFFKLFMIGVFSQATNYSQFGEGATFNGKFYPLMVLPGCDHWCYAFELDTSRIPGILQRIGWGYLVASLCEIYLRPDEGGEGPDGHLSPLALFRMYWKQWSAFFLITAVYLGLLFGIDVPGCGRGHITPGCNAARELDRWVMGYKHMYPSPTLYRGHECSPCAPRPWSECPLLDAGFVPAPYCPQSPAPYAVGIPFDPEGILTSISAAGSSLLGLAFGHVLLHRKEHGARLREWAPLSLACLAVGFAVHFGGFPINKNLWSTSYVFFMAGVAGLALSIFYTVVDVWQVQLPFQPLRYQGLNTIFVFTMAATGVFDTFVSLFYWKEPGNDLLSQTRDHFFIRTLGLGEDAGTLCFVFLKIAFWWAASGFLFWRGIFYKV